MQLVPETVLKRKHDMDALKAKRMSAELERPRGNRKVFSSKKKMTVRKPEGFIANAKMRLHHLQRHKRVTKKGMQKRASKKVVVEETTVVNDDDVDIDDSTDKEVITVAQNSIGSHCVFCIRIRSGIGAPRQVTRTLRLLRLNNVYEGVFLKYDTATQKLLHLVEPFVLYGAVTPATTKDLIVRRGHAKVNKRRTPLSDNMLVEDNLGKTTGMICIEDVVHELATDGPHFSKATQFLSPFHFKAPKSRFQLDKLNQRVTDDYGDKGERMDEYIRQML